MQGVTTSVTVSKPRVTVCVKSIGKTVRRVTADGSVANVNIGYDTSSAYQSSNTTITGATGLTVSSTATIILSL